MTEELTIQDWDKQGRRTVENFPRADGIKSEVFPGQMTYIGPKLKNYAENNQKLEVLYNFC